MMLDGVTERSARVYKPVPVTSVDPVPSSTARAGARDSLIMADKTRLHVKDWGEGPPVILLSGWPLSADSWDDVALFLAQAGYRVLFYDRRGFGRSAQPWGGYDYDTLADDLASVIQQTGIQDAALIGFSMGGGEVARYMSRHAGRCVSKAVLISSVVPFMLRSDDNPDGTPRSAFETMEQKLREDRARFFGEFFKDFFGVGVLTRPVSPEVIEWARAMAMQAGLRPTLECARAFATTDFRPDLAAFRVPTFLIHGAADKTVPIEASARAAHQAIAGSKLIEYEGAPHGLFATHKVRLNEDILAFLKR